MIPWLQIYDPLHNPLVSTLAAFLPAILLLVSLGLLRVKAHVAALIGMVSSLLVAVWIFGMPPAAALASAGFGMAYGLFPIGWIILNVIFLFRLTEEKGLFQVLQASLTVVTQDRRLQLILVAFCFGAFLEGAAGFGTPVAVAASILVGLGFPALAAGGMALIANTAPVPFAGLGTPVIALQAVTGLNLLALTRTIALQLSLFDILIPFWLIIALAGWSACLEVWPALLVVGASYAVVQFLVAWLHGPWLVNIISSIASMVVLVFFLRIWKPRRIWRFPAEEQLAAGSAPAYTRMQIFRAWAPWLILSVLVFIWGLPQVKTWLDSFSLVRIHVPWLDGLILRSPPIVPAARVEPAIFDFTWLSASGTAILIAAVISGLWMGFSPRELIKQYGATLHQVRYSLLTIAAMMAIGFIARFAGLDAAMGLAFASTGALYPFFGTLLGWLGVFITGSDTSSNVLFGSLQVITANQLKLNPLIMASANSSGGVMGKMINAQSIVVAATAVRAVGKESDFLRYVFFHSLALVALVGLLVMAQIYLF